MYLDAAKKQEIFSKYGMNPSLYVGIQYVMFFISVYVKFSIIKVVKYNQPVSLLNIRGLRFKLL